MTTETYKKPGRERECILEDGRFARMRRLSAFDWLVMQNGGGMTPANMVCLISRAVTIEGRALTVDEVQAMDLDDYVPIHRMVWKRISEALGSQAIA